MSKRRSFSFFSRKKEESPKKPTPVSSDLAMRIIEKELELEKSWNFRVIHELIALYTKMIEFYEQNNNPKYYDFQDRMHKMLIKPQVIAALQKVNCPTKEEKQQPPVKFINERSPSKRKESEAPKTPKPTLSDESIMENNKNIDPVRESEVKEESGMKEEIEMKEENAIQEEDIIKKEAVAVKPETVSEKKTPTEMPVEISSLAQRKEQAELTRRILSRELTQNLKKPQTNRKANIIIERQNSTSKESSQRAAADFKSQDSALERRIASRKMSQLTRSMTLNPYNPSELSRVFGCDLSDLEEEKNTSTKSSFFTSDDLQVENFESFEKKLEEIMEKNFTERATRIAEVQFHYESQMRDISGMGDLQDMLITQMKINMQEEINTIMQEFDNKRKEEVQRLKDEMTS